MDESKRVILVTGGGSGIGKSIAHGFAKEGATLYITGRRTSVLEEAQKELEESGADARIIPADISKTEEVQKLISRIDSEAGRLDVLVNAAGVFHLGFVHETPEEDFNAIFDSNVRGLWLACKYSIPLLRKSQFPNIINISSIAGSRSDPALGVYEASKAAVNSLTKVMARELAKEKIRVNAIAPGPVDTELYTGSILGDDLEKATMRRGELEQSVPFGRLGAPEEVARLALFLASPESDFISGSVTSIDGAMGY